MVWFGLEGVFFVSFLKCFDVDLGMWEMRRFLFLGMSEHAAWDSF